MVSFKVIVLALTLYLPLLSAWEESSIVLALPLLLLGIGLLVTLRQASPQPADLLLPTNPAGRLMDLGRWSDLSSGDWPSQSAREREWEEYLTGEARTVTRLTVLGSVASEAESSA
jgi:hypothetical protein